MVIVTSLIEKLHDQGEILLLGLEGRYQGGSLIIFFK